MGDVWEEIVGNPIWILANTPAAISADRVEVSKESDIPGRFRLADIAKDLFNHQRSHEIREFHLLKYGRHMRLDPETKIIVGRTQKDNENILSYCDPESDILMNPYIPGPVLLIPRGGSGGIVLKAASICAGYIKISGDAPVGIVVSSPAGKRSINVKPIYPAEIRHLLI